MRSTLFSGAYHTLHDLKKYRHLFWQFILFACGALLTRGITIMFAPIAMHILSPSEYGLIALANNFSQILNAFLGLGLRQALPMFYFQYDQQEKSNLIIDIICIYCSFALPILILALWAMPYIKQFIFMNNASTLLILLSLATSFMYFFVELLYQLMRFHQKAWLLTFTQTGVACSIITTNLLFLCMLNFGPCSLLIGQATGMLIACMVGVYMLMKKHTLIRFNLQRSLQTTRSYIWYGLPFIPSMLFSILLASGDRWVLAHVATLHDVGIYSLANTLAQLINMIILYAMLGSYIPHILKKFNAEKEKTLCIEQENRKTMWYAMGILFVLLIAGFSSTKSMLYYLIPSKFHEAINYMGLLLIGSIFYLGTHFLNCLMLYKKKSTFLGAVLILPALLNIALNMLCIPYMGIYGCVFGTVCSYVVYFIVTLLYNNCLVQNHKKDTFLQLPQMSS